MQQTVALSTNERVTVFAVFIAFLKLGMTSFGRPITHLGYFREEFVVRNRWLDDANYADVNAAVVGLLLAALYHPVWTSGILSPADFGLGPATVALLVFWRMPPCLGCPD